MSELYPESGGTIELDVPGNYLVTMRGLFVDPDIVGEPIIFAGDPSDYLDVTLSACILASDFFVPLCDATFPLTVREDEVVSLPVQFASLDSDGCTGPDCEPPVVVRLAVYRLGGAVTDALDLPDLGGCLCEPVGRPFSARKGAIQRYLQNAF